MNRVTRRRVLGVLGAGVAAPRLLFAQAAKLPTVAVLFVGDAEDDEPGAKPFFDAMTRFGWIEGKTIVYDRHSGKGTRQYLETMASNAADAEPDLIFATTGSLASAVLRETSSVPVVFATMADPVTGGLVVSLARPGGNATGVFQTSGDTMPRRYALLRQALPEVKRVGSVFDRGLPNVTVRREAQEKAAKAAGVELAPVEFTNFEAIARIFANYKRDGVRVCEVTPSFALTGRRREAVALAERNGIALFAHRAEWADAGAIFSYGIDIGDSYRRAAAMTNRILRGTRPAVIAVETPARFELVANPGAAIALGYSLPAKFLKQASRIVAAAPGQGS